MNGKETDSPNGVLVEHTASAFKGYLLVKFHFFLMQIEEPVFSEVFFNVAVKKLNPFLSQCNNLGKNPV